MALNQHPCDAEQTAHDFGDAEEMPSANQKDRESEEKMETLEKRKNKNKKKVFW